MHKQFANCLRNLSRLLLLSCLNFAFFLFLVFPHDCEIKSGHYEAKLQAPPLQQAIPSIVCESGLDPSCNPSTPEYSHTACIPCWDPDPMNKALHNFSWDLITLLWYWYTHGNWMQDKEYFNKKRMLSNENKCYHSTKAANLRNYVDEVNRTLVLGRREQNLYMGGVKFYSSSCETWGGPVATAPTMSHLVFPWQLLEWHMQMWNSKGCSLQCCFSIYIMFRLYMAF